MLTKSGLILKEKGLIEWIDFKRKLNLKLIFCNNEKVIIVLKILMGNRKMKREKKQTSVPH